VMNDDNNIHTNISPGLNFQQYDSSSNNTIISPSQSTPNDIYNNIDTISNHQQYNFLNNISHYNYQQPMSTYNNVSPPQFYPQHIDQDPQLSNVFSLLNSLGININSPQTNIIFIPATDSDNQNRFQLI
jgi:hypothetical protein